MIAVDPAQLHDLASMGPLGHRHLKALIVQVARSYAVTAHDGGHVLAIAGIYPHRDHGEVWLHVAPGLRGSPMAGPLVRRLLGVAAGLRRIAVIVKDDCREGMRMAELAGFRQREILVFEHMPEDRFIRLVK